MMRGTAQGRTAAHLKKLCQHESGGIQVAQDAFTYLERRFAIEI
jgi:hypothetical protein